MSVAGIASRGTYYNEFEPYAAAWLRNLIAAGHLPAGEVDERSIVDVAPDDLAGFRQCHFFAGIGGWALAARLAGWPDDRELWTGSAPCQPFSVAGKGKAQADDRHLWPHLFRLASARRPAVLMGEQVAAAVGKDWLDGIAADLESVGYACGSVVIPACAVDAPHRRDRLWFVADADHARSQGLAGDVVCASGGRGESPRSAAETGLLDCAEQPGGYVADANQPRAREGWEQRGAQFGGAGSDSRACAGDVADPSRELHNGSGNERSGWRPEYSDGRASCDVEYAESNGRGEGRSFADGLHLAPLSGWQGESAGAGSAWGNHAWIIGHDGKARRVEPGIRLLAHGVPARVGKLRAYGNAIVPQVAAEVIAAYMDCRP